MAAGRPKRDLVFQNQELRNRVQDLEHQVAKYVKLQRAIIAGVPGPICEALNSLPGPETSHQKRRTFTPQFKREFLAEVKRTNKLEHMLRKYSVQRDSYYQWCSQAKRDRQASSQPTVGGPLEPSFEGLED